MRTRRRVAAGVAALVVVGVLGWLIFGGGEDDGDPATTTATTSTAADPAAAIVDDLTTEQLVDQLLLVGFDGTDGSAPFLADLRERALGGVLIRSDNWFGADQGAALIDAVRAAGAGGLVPPLVVAAQEGGRYRSFADLPPEETELEIGDAGKLGLAKDWAKSTGAALRDVGFDLNLFPVADVATLDSPIGDRAFSDDPQVTAAMTAAAMRGCAAAEIACAPLHFPGLGAASQDTASGPATVSLDPATLSARDLEPFRAAFAEGAPAVLLSLAFYAAYDPVTPGAMTEGVATGLLRDELGFEGVAIADDLDSGAVRASYPIGAAAVAAIAAGADMVEVASPELQDKVRTALIEAATDGTLSNARLLEAAGRVVAMKQALSLLETAEPTG